jgi:hypothetical protein
MIRVDHVGVPARARLNAAGLLTGLFGLTARLLTTVDSPGCESVPSSRSCSMTLSRSSQCTSRSLSTTTPLTRSSGGCSPGASHTAASPTTRRTVGSITRCPNAACSSKRPTGTLRADDLMFRRTMTPAITGDRAEARDPRAALLQCCRGAAVRHRVRSQGGPTPGLQTAAPPSQLAGPRIPRMGAGDELRCRRDAEPRPRSAPTPSAATHHEHPTRRPSRPRTRPCTTSQRCRYSSASRQQRLPTHDDYTDPKTQPGRSALPPQACPCSPPWARRRRLQSSTTARQPRRTAPTRRDRDRIQLAHSTINTHTPALASPKRTPSNLIATACSRCPAHPRDPSSGRHGHPSRDPTCNGSRSTDLVRNRTRKSPIARAG